MSYLHLCALFDSSPTLDIFTSMGVLLTLKTMDNVKLELIGDNEEEKSLEKGMKFLSCQQEKHACCPVCYHGRPDLEPDKDTRSSSQ